MYHFELRPFKRSVNPIQEWEKEVEKIFDGFGGDARFSPACEILDEDKHFTLSLDVPGLRREDLDIEVKDNQLYISGERKSENKAEKNNVLRSERRYGKFSRVFTLPLNVKTDAISARFENGVLELSIPKEEKSQPKKITISDWKKEEVLTDLKN
jgi:HSP20 family protein